VIELRHLRYFLVLSEELHFRRAAARLLMTQPPLSLAIQRLEDDIGVVLFERTSRVVTATEAGRVLAEQTRKVLASVDVAVAETRRAGGVGCGLRVGFTPHLPIEQLLQFLRVLHRHDLNVRAEVRHAVAVEQLQSLRRGELDIAILPWAANEEKLEFEPLFPGEPLAAFLASDHPLASRKVLGPAELAQEALVSFPREVNPSLAAWLGAQIERAGYRFRGVDEAGGSNARDWVLAVAGGSGVALLPHRFKEVADAGPLVLRRPLEPRLEMPETVLAWRTNPPAQLGALLATVRELARGLRREAGSSSNHDR
jgi:DNA-binding transcriptional LysR family regulator